MASGGKELVVNTQERAVSTDINRGQKFANADRAELLRFMMDVTASDDLDAGGVLTGSNDGSAFGAGTVASPVLAEILGGFLVRPQGGSVNLLVDQGVMMAFAPDAAPDDSSYKYVRDPGVSVAGTLTISPNASGSIRIDVVEVQVTPTVVETDNRDVFDPTTGLFVPRSVSKARTDLLAYRVRLGTPGSGFPGTASGWLPLAVISVPDATTTCDTCTFWDVRPLVNDREFGLCGLGRSQPLIKRSDYYGDATVPGGTTDYVVKGMVEGVITQGGRSRRVGGELRRGTPGADAASVDLGSSANWEPGIANLSSGTTMYYAYLVTPCGLPRWARYTTGPAGRVPRSPRGIVMLSIVPPRTNGVPFGPVTTPASTGLLATTTDGVCFLASYGGGGANTLASSLQAVGKEVYGGDPTGIIVGGFTNLAPSVAATLTLAKYTVLSGTGAVGRFPPNARRLLVSATVLLTNPTGAPIAFTVDPDTMSVDVAGTPAATSGGVFLQGARQQVTVAAAGTFLINCVARWIPVPGAYAQPAAANVQFELKHAYNVVGGAGLTLSQAFLTIHGYEM